MARGRRRLTAQNRDYRMAIDPNALSSEARASSAP
jgi:hypothetical protein